MSDSGTLLDYHGLIDLKVIELLLKKLRKNKNFTALNKTTRKRVYGLVVECLENICKNTIIKSPTDQVKNPYISVVMEIDKIYIVAGNPIPDSAKGNIAERLLQVNNLDEPALKSLYEHKINSESNLEENGAGLGFISMALKSGNKIGFRFESLNNDNSYFELKISINKYIMRKLIIDKTSSSPKVVLDPENKIYLISGESRPPDVREFYNQILSWLEEFRLHLIKSDEKNPVEFHFDFEYFNSSSGKLILDICKFLVSLRLQGINIIVKWHYEKEDGDMLEVGKEMSRIVKFPFEYIESE